VIPVVVLVAALSSAPAAAQVGAPDPILEDPEATYGLCLDTARAYPEQGFELAGKWAALGGGEPARHCRAVALIGLREYAEAGASLEDLAQASKREARVRAGMLAQAAQAWLLAGDTGRAHAAQTAALQLAPGDADLLIDRAMTLAEAKNYWEAIDDLNAALAARPDDADALAFRASAYRMVEADDLALEDAERAVALAPGNLNARLERGILYRLQGRDAEARADWLKILELAPDGEPARLARENIERLDVKPDAGAQ
jgi:tetratricopeptide (TPR) repeat protein